MNEHTRSIIKKMITLLDDYKEGRCNLRTLVDGLEGGLNAIEEKMPETFQKSWYVHWGGLEQILAMGTEKARQKEILEDIEALMALLSKF
jgi:hypothetical protein